MTDPFNSLLVTSDPNISTVCRSFHRLKKRIKISNSCAKLIKNNNLKENIAESEEDEIEVEIEKSVDINNNEMEIDDDETDKKFFF
ncbi:unnamed protein product [Brachionus calyciflorus]|uniref:Uncharacterized protein n=1 Tax=Brachionus calyciflorus TaxID=104777 RepID=A0A814MPV6_9BILA|nr:unnamed protein product [Brachionus calyciflorus]